MNDQEQVSPIEIDQPATDPEVELALEQAPEAVEEPSDPDSWLQWALIIGVLLLFLICALLILIAWSRT